MLALLGGIFFKSGLLKFFTLFLDLESINKVWEANLYYVLIYFLAVIYNIEGSKLEIFVFFFW